MATMTMLSDCYAQGWRGIGYFSSGVLVDEGSILGFLSNSYRPNYSKKQHCQIFHMNLFWEEWCISNYF